MADRNARVWTGSQWESISSPVSVPNAVAVWQSTAPSSPITGQLWIDSDDNSMYVWSGAAWTSILVDFSSLQSQINAKEKEIPLQNSAPSSPSSSDLWVDNTDPTKPVLKVYNGSAWITAGSSITADDDQIVLASRIFG